MSINLEKAYFKKLEEYVGKKLNIVSNENEITIIYDVETSYVLQEEKEIFYFYCIQRNERIKIAEYYSEKEMETNFAIAIKGFFSEGIDYSGLEKIEGVVKLSDVNEIMKVHIGESYYSIMNPQKLKINLEEKGEINIIFICLDQMVNVSISKKMKKLRLGLRGFIMKRCI